MSPPVNRAKYTDLVGVSTPRKLRPCSVYNYYLFNTRNDNGKPPVYHYRVPRAMLADALNQVSNPSLTGAGEPARLSSCVSYETREKSRTPHTPACRETRRGPLRGK